MIKTYTFYLKSVLLTAILIFFFISYHWVQRNCNEIDSQPLWDKYREIWNTLTLTSYWAIISKKINIFYNNCKDSDFQVNWKTVCYKHTLFTLIYLNFHNILIYWSSQICGWLQGETWAHIHHDKYILIKREQPLIIIPPPSWMKFMLIDVNQ